MKKKIENIKKIMILEDYVLKLLIEHNYRLLENDGQNYQYIRSWYSLAGLEKRSSFLGGNPSSKKKKNSLFFFLITFKFVFE